MTSPQWQWHAGNHKWEVDAAKVKDGKMSQDKWCLLYCLPTQWPVIMWIGLENYCQLVNGTGYPRQRKLELLMQISPVRGLCCMFNVFRFSISIAERLWNYSLLSCNGERRNAIFPFIAESLKSFYCLRSSWSMTCEAIKKPLTEELACCYRETNNCMMKNWDVESLS